MLHDRLAKYRVAEPDGLARSFSSTSTRRSRRKNGGTAVSRIGGRKGGWGGLEEELQIVLTSGGRVS